VASVSEGLVLPEVVRGTLLPEAARLARLDEALPQIRAVLDGESDAVALQATLACLLWDALPQVNWCGFYRRISVELLAVGPYQGTMGCLRIPLGRGVCGAAARENRRMRVDDVDAFADHIACDSRTRSELVLPIAVAGEVRAVLDLDSTHPAGFSDGEAERLEALLREVFSPSTRW
jgi:GAF domain-containing protein